MGRGVGTLGQQILEYVERLGEPTQNEDGTWDLSHLETVAVGELADELLQGAEHGRQRVLQSVNRLEDRRLVESFRAPRYEWGSDERRRQSPNTAAGVQKHSQFV